MSLLSIWFYFGLMTVYLLLAWGFSHWLPFFRQIYFEEKHSGRQLSIDGLRGMLALSVFFLHAAEFYGYRTSGRWLPPPSNVFAQFGVLAVTLFFFITGYVFWRKLSRQSHIPAVPFLYARLARLGPAYLFACVWLFLLTASVSAFHRHVSHVLLIGQGAAWLSLLGSGHEINAMPLTKIWLGPAWTLRAEGYFYLSLPLLGWFARNRKRLFLLVGVAAILAFLIGLIHKAGLAGAFVEMVRSYFFFLACMFSVGMATATLRATDRMKEFAQGRLASLVCLGLLAMVLVWIHPAYGYAESCCLALPFLCICWGNTFFGLLTSRPALFLGRISYSFYLLHLLTLASADALLGKVLNPTQHGVLAFWAFAGVCGAVALVIASVSYQFLEHPFLYVRLERRSSSKAVQIRLVAATLDVPAEG